MPCRLSMFRLHAAVADARRNGCRPTLYKPARQRLSQDRGQTDQRRLLRAFHARAQNHGRVWCRWARSGVRGRMSPPGSRPRRLSKSARLKLPKGTWSIWAIPGEKEWTLIVNKQSGQHHLDYDAAEDFGRTKMTVKMLAAPVETFRIELSSNGGNKGTLALIWENDRSVDPLYRFAVMRFRPSCGVRALTLRRPACEAFSRPRMPGERSTAKRGEDPRDTPIRTTGAAGSAAPESLRSAVSGGRMISRAGVVGGIGVRIENEFRPINGEGKSRSAGNGIERLVKFVWSESRSVHRSRHGFGAEAQEHGGNQNCFHSTGLVRSAAGKFAGSGR